MAGYELLEHTADVGLRVTGATLEEVFEQATLGMAEIAGVWSPGPGGDDVRIDVAADDLGGLLVDWLSEVLYLYDARTAGITGVRVERVAAGRATGIVSIGALGRGAGDGTQVKAVTYHQLGVDERPDGCVATVFFDI